MAFCTNADHANQNSIRLVEELGLKSALTEYKVPREDLPKIAEKALGTVPTDPLHERTVKLLESLY